MHKSFHNQAIDTISLSKRHQYLMYQYFLSEFWQVICTDSEYCKSHGYEKRWEEKKYEVSSIKILCI